VGWPESFKSRGGVMAGAILTVALVTSGVLAKRSAESGEPEQAPAEALVGLVRPIEVQTIAARTPLAIAELLVSVGDEVKPDQRIARRDTAEEERRAATLSVAVEGAQQEVKFRQQALDTMEQSLHALVRKTSELSGELAIAELQVQQVPMRQARDSPDRARAAYEQAQIRARRADDLWKNGLIAQQELDDARLVVRLAADDLANARSASDASARLHDLEVLQAKARRELSIIEQRQKIAEQRAALERAQLQLKANEMQYADAQAVLADPFIHAPLAGSVLEMPVTAGEQVAAGGLIARIGRLDQMAVHVDVAPTIVNALHVNDRARIEVTAALFSAQAQIRSIAPLPNDAGTYEVQLVFANPAHARLAGLAARTWLALPARGSRS